MYSLGIEVHATVVDQLQQARQLMNSNHLPESQTFIIYRVSQTDFNKFDKHINVLPTISFIMIIAQEPIKVMNL